MNAFCRICVTSLLICITAPFFGAGCMYTAENMGDYRASVEKMISEPRVAQSLPTMRCYITQTMNRCVVITADNIVFGQPVFGHIEEDFHLPLAHVTNVEIVSDAIGFRGRAHAGLRLTFDTPVVKNIYSIGGNQVAFDVLMAHMVQNGHITQSFEVVPSMAASQDEGPARAVAQLLAPAPVNQSVAAAPKGDVEAKLKQLKELLDKGLIDKASYDAKTAELLRSI